ncbi:epoxide hydrolase [Occultella glacieicola]|uniref:Epoxide hydrolase n=1 Tax=Occultella glacieicola TaxID=2518684 RepID=A0ABY2E5A6_9MICO|nr:epoxide hydrolase family protein [Occultella glacieicola]TDE94027.1 epoxide hydrolase [Occultella glacieicola]
MTASEITPATIDIPQADLDDLADRLARTRWVDEIEGSGSEYGTSLAQVREWAEYWRTSFDWRAVEARLNAYPQFTTEIDGQRIHFLHVRSPRPDATALILTHGWPGSVLEYLDVIDPLVAAGFDLVIPSLPGFGFSGPTTERGWGVHRTAAAWVELMRRLGYERYGAVGNDAGSMISPEVGRLAPESVIGVHVTQLFSFPSGDPAELADLTAQEQAGMERLSWFWENMGAFNLIQTQAPQTLAHALADSPVGLLGWNGQLLVGLDPEFVVANVALYWLTGTSGSSIRMYREMAGDPKPEGQTTAPTALAAGAKDFLAIRRFAERDHATITRWNVFDVPGHYTAYEAPQVIVDDVTAFFADLASGAGGAA